MDKLCTSDSYLAVSEHPVIFRVRIIYRSVPINVTKTKNNTNDLPSKFDTVYVGGLHSFRKIKQQNEVWAKSYTSFITLEK